MQELRRLYVVDEVGKNAESWFLSRVIRSLSCGLLVAYTAPDAGHYGACYQAANFAFHGSVARSSYHYVDDDGRIRHKRSIWDRAKRRNVTEGEYAASLGLVRVEERPKLIYSYLRDRRQIQLGVLPYPKPDR